MPKGNVAGDGRIENQRVHLVDQMICIGIKDPGPHQVAGHRSRTYL